MKAQALFTLSVLAVMLQSSRGARAKFPLLRCSETSISSGAYGAYYFPTYHPSSTASTDLCGGDPLDMAWFMLDTTTGNIRYRVSGANAYNLYEVYWLPVAGDPVSDRVLLGQFTTSSTGRGTNSFIRSISTPSDSSSGALVDFWTATGSSSDLGLFFVYSRGPYYSTSTGMYNTADGSAMTALINPTLWGGSSGFDGVQYVGTFGYL